MQALGRHLLVEFYECDAKKLNDILYIEPEMIQATKASGATIISHDFHRFSPHGISGVIVIAESHVSIHTWPEYRYAAVDIFTCGETIDPWVIQRQLKISLNPMHVSSAEMKRGLFNLPTGEKLSFKPEAKPSQNDQ